MRTPRRGWLHWRRNDGGGKKVEPRKIGQWNQYIMAPTPALAHMHTHTHTHTCHVLLLFITIIVTTGIVFVVLKYRPLFLYIHTYI